LATMKTRLSADAADAAATKAQARRADTDRMRHRRNERIALIR
jgi:hypothetical protein